MANCASCGATSVEGASHCGACGRPLAPPAAVVPQPSAVPPPAPAYGPPPAAPGYPPPSGPQAGGPPALGSWGAGRPYEKSPAAQRLLTAAHWRPALRAAVAPTVVLLLVALIAAVSSDYSSYDSTEPVPGFGDRFTGMLSMTLNALGAPFRLGARTPSGRSGSESAATTFWAVPMTVTVLWFLALWLGLRAERRRSKADGSQLTRDQAAAEALRTAVVLGLVTALLGLFGSTTWNPGGTTVSSDFLGIGGRRTAQPDITADSGWLWAVGWSALLGGLLAFAVHGTDALRWAAWRSRSVRGWAVAALTAGQALALTLGLASVTGFVLVAANADEGWQTATALAFLPNIGLLLLGLGSGATLRMRSDLSGTASEWAGSAGDRAEFSFFDLHDQSADWRWTGLLALASVGVLGWTAYRRRLDAADRLRLAVVYAGLLTALTAVAGILMTVSMSYVMPSVGSWGGSGRMDNSKEMSLSLAFVGVLVACVVWAVVGALLVPAVLGAFGGRGGAVPYGAAPYGAQPQGAQPYGAQSYGPVPPQVPYPTGPAYGAAPQAAPPQDAVAPQAAPPAPPAPAAPPEVPRPAEEPVDPTVWRDHP